MIELLNVSIVYQDEIFALSKLTLCIKRGEFVFVVGPSGAGKSTLLKMLYLAERPTEGKVILDGTDLSTLKDKDIPLLRRRIGIVQQDFGLLPDRTVYENVAYAMRVIGSTRKEVRIRIPEALERVGMSHRPDAFPVQLSGGEQQRVAIARAIVNHPGLVLADEPTGNLDPETSAGIVELLGEINSHGSTVLVATHDTAIVDRMKQRVLEFSGGYLLRDESKGVYSSDTIPATENHTE